MTCGSLLLVAALIRISVNTTGREIVAADSDSAFGDSAGSGSGESAHARESLALVCALVISHVVQVRVSDRAK